MSPGIELLRGLAALMVVVAHYRGLAGLDAWPVTFMFTGVDLFFVISGFVFAPYFTGKPLRWDAFLIRRFFRIYPLYAVALLVYGAIRWRSEGAVDHVAAHLLFLHTMQSREIAFYFNPAFWSLPPEVEFYLALPILVLLVRGVAAFAWLAALALGMHLWVAWQQPLDPAAQTLIVVLAFHLPGLLIEFLLGGAAWFVLQCRPGPGLRTLLLALGLVLWMALARLFAELGDAGIYAIEGLRGNLGLLAALSYALMLCALIPLLDRASSSLQRACWTLGNLSFGVYLLHNAMPVLLQPWHQHLPPLAFASVCLLATLLSAWLLHRVCEAPMRRIGRTWAASREGRTALVQKL